MTIAATKIVLIDAGEIAMSAIARLFHYADLTTLTRAA